MDPDRERKAQEYVIRRSDELASEWAETEKWLRSGGGPAGGQPDSAALAKAFVDIIQKRIDALIEGYLKHAIDEPYTRYDREFLARQATEEAGRICEHVRERFGDALANEYRVQLEGHAVDALKHFLDPV
jgi:hypothetical protein